MRFHAAFFSILLSSSSFAVLQAKTPKDTVVVAWEQTPRTFDPRFALDAESQYLENLVHCALITYSPKGLILGELAESWQWVNDKTLAMTLKTAAKFGDGTAVTGADVKATYDYFLKKDPNELSPRAGAFKFLKEVELAKDKVIFHLTAADATFISNLVIGILPAAVASKGMFDINAKVKGCGPFNLDEAGLNSIKLSANPHYTLGTKAKSAFVEFKIIKDENTRLSKLRSGELDICQNSVSINTIETIKKSYKDLSVVTLPALKTAYVGFNFQDEILKNVKVRQAISLAINREAIIKYLLKGLASPSVTMLPPSDPYYNPALTKLSYDPAKAKQLLDEAGYKLSAGAKERFTLSYKTSTNETSIGIARTVASDLGKVGIKATVQPLEWGRLKEDVEKGHIQLWGLKWIGFKDPDIYRYAFATESFTPVGGNRGRFSNPEIDTLLEHARMSVDDNVRKQDYLKVQELIYEQAPYAFLFHDDNYAVLRKSVQGFELYVDGRYSSLKDTYKTE